MTTLIEQLAAAKGIASEYVDAWGHPAQVSEESKAASSFFLDSLGWGWRMIRVLSSNPIAAMAALYPASRCTATTELGLSERS